MDSERAGSSKKIGPSDATQKVTATKPFSSVKPRYLSSVVRKEQPRSISTSNPKVIDLRTSSGIIASTPRGNSAATLPLGCDISVVQLPKASRNQLSSPFKGSKLKSQGNAKEAMADINAEDLKQEWIDEAYNTYLASAAAKVLLDRSKWKMKTGIDEQLAALQKRVNDNLDILEDTKRKVDAVCALDERSALLDFQDSVNLSLKEEPALTQGKSLTQLMDEVERIKNQLPCKNVLIPETKPDIAHLHNATSKLLSTLDHISKAHGAEQLSTEDTLSRLREVVKEKESLGIVEQSLTQVCPKASACILNDAALKGTRDILSSLETRNN